jgi:hypothetical protein
MVLYLDGHVEPIDSADAANAIFAAVGECGHTQAVI